MKLTPKCYDCLRGLILQAAGLATVETSLKQRAIAEATKILDAEFSYDQISITIAAKIHRVIREITGNTDPYRAMKNKELALVRELYPGIISLYEDGLTGRLKVAAAANAIDFFKKHSSLREEMSSPMEFAIDDSGYLETKLKSANKVLYLADNAGEIYFDLPLVKWMRQITEVIYVVKPSPVQNDATMDELRQTGLEKEFGEIMTIDTASPGILFPLAPTRLRSEFESADIVFAKGMGHYESLSELPHEGNFFHCLMAKCQPVADSLGVPLNSYVAALR
ncbi:MAG: DUF89 family protein [Dehalococcoidia bacterium]|nr:DUF89 family protein [Dehalococcoidia bacterium]